MRSMWKRVMYGALAMVVAATVAIPSGLSVQAAEKTCKITITPVMTDGSKVDGSYSGTFDVYKVADMDISAETIKFVSTAFDAYVTANPSVVDDNKNAWSYFSYSAKATYENEDAYNKAKQQAEQHSREQADVLKKYVKAHSIGTYDGGAAVKSGTTIDVEPGVYLILQHSSPSDYYDCNAFLVFAPSLTWDDTNNKAITNNEVTATPKLEKKPTPPVTPPDGGGDEGGDDGGDDNPPTPPKPPVTPPKEEEGEDEETPVEETPEQPGEDIGNMGDDGSMTEGEGGMMTDAGAMTGDNSQMTTYAAVAGVAAVALIGWVVWKKRSKKSN